MSKFVDRKPNLRYPWMAHTIFTTEGHPRLPRLFDRREVHSNSILKLHYGNCVIDYTHSIVCRASWIIFLHQRTRDVIHDINLILEMFFNSFSYATPKCAGCSPFIMRASPYLMVGWGKNAENSACHWSGKIIVLRHNLFHFPDSAWWCLWSFIPHTT